MSNPKKDRIEDEYLDQKKQQQTGEKTKSIYDTLTTQTDSLRKIQEDNRKMFEKNIEAIDQYQDQMIDIARDFSNNYLTLERKIVNTSKSTCDKFLENFHQIYWNNSIIPEQYKNLYDIVNKNLVNSWFDTAGLVTVNMEESQRFFNKSFEASQKYIRDKNHECFEYLRDLERSYYK